jgi:hypothetical protein
MNDPALIPADALYRVVVTCPACGQHVEVMLGLAAQLTRQKGESKLGLKCAQQKENHRCSATQMTIVAATGEILGEAGPDA